MKFIRKYWPVFTLLFIELLLFLTNYKSGTFLVGWDNLYPEFNFALNFKRDFTAIWQQYRGLGLIDGMSHAANLPHDLERLFLSLFLPLNLIRWAYIFLMHLLGGLGMYFLLKMSLRPQTQSGGSNPVTNQGNINEIAASPSTIAQGPRNDVSAFFGTLFYQFNLATIQQFFLPFEVFVVHFATLPWLILFCLKYLDYGKKKYLIVFFIISLLSTPQAHVPTVFMVYILAIFIILIAKVLTKTASVKRAIIIISVIFCVNAFWGLPFAYSTLTNSKVIANSKNFQMGTNDIFYRNNKFGDFADVVLLKGIVTDYQHYDYQSDEYGLMMAPWLENIKTGYFIYPAWFFFFLSVFGFFVSLKNRRTIPFAVLFLISFFMMSTDTPVIGGISRFLRDHIPLFSVIFRFVFTKFSILYAFSYTVSLSIGIYFIITKLTHINEAFKPWNTRILSILTLFLILYAAPAFQGNFFYKNLAVKIPQEYFQTFNFFQKQNSNTRIAELPIPWYWAWIQTKWGTIGSGFIWYGIPQPITDLAFTPWSANNENFYWELEQAVYSNNPSLLAKVFKKYDITWVYLDENIFLDQARKFTYDQYESLLEKTPGVNLTKQYNLIKIYKYKGTGSLNDFSGVKNDVQNIGPIYKYDNYDTAYINHGDYITSSQPLDFYYPFRSIFSAKNPSDQEYQIEENDDYIIFKSKLPQAMKSATVIAPLPQPEAVIENGYLMVKLKKSDILIYDNKEDPAYLNQNNNACPRNEKGLSTLEKNRTGFKLTSQGSHNCVKIDMPNFPQIYGYLFNIQATTDKKRGLFINFFDENLKKSDLETYLDSDGKYHNYYFVLPPRQPDGNGYTLFLDNISDGREKVINTIGKIKIYKIPYDYLKNLKITNNEINTNTRSIVYLSQSFHPGWEAYYLPTTATAAVRKLLMNYFPYLFGEKINNHFPVNNWANGWEIGSQMQSAQTDSKLISTIVIIFWPQYLEYIGFGLLFITFLFLFKYSNSK